MLILTRKTGERIQVGDDLTITVVEIDGNKIRLGFDAPKSVKIYREEVLPKLKDAQTVKEGAK